MPHYCRKHIKRYQIPTHLVQPLWFRSRESLADDGLIYDPIAAQACLSCHVAPDCLDGNIDQKQLLHVTLTQICDRQVRDFLSIYPDAWIINVGAGLDTRFYRVDNGRCHWIEVDISENLIWRQKLFHPSERYQHMNGSVDSLAWLKTVVIPESAPLLILCEHALLSVQTESISHFIRALGLSFPHAHACLLLAGDKSGTRLGQKLGAGFYQHGFASPGNAVLSALPWAKGVRTFSPLDFPCRRWKIWQRLVCHLTTFKFRYTPVVVHIYW
ncbi:Leucine carboxyl methyltransferase [Vibrio mangrovi]|uniref:Class I SAM-dependent methyltransferase n=2 Tax=Vibrio mangrovi TaxID=474394 RepID=A0A1Y6IW25_9VIBR|nr:class I SAM-dependent methyltransferase [Vibrio mangrovi]MDW6002611.1 class I SAM-dependent methyltransferase [Vibrio mangrovi]SMS01857.1 Leucine carboxyl methyltransferase [Vibrio mangrovi]